MDLYNLTTKIPYIIMLGVGIAVVLQINIGALTNLSTSIETGSQAQYDQTIVLEHALNVELDDSELEVYEENYDRPELLETRSFVPLEFFTDQGELGYSTHGSDCYIPRVPGLDGEEFGFFVSETGSGSATGLSCTASRSDYRKAPVIAIDESGERHALEVHIYEVS